MSEETPFKSCISLSKEQIRVNHSKTKTLLHASFMHGEHDAFKEHMENTSVHYNFNGSLAHGIKLVMGNKRTLSDVAPTLIILLQNGAKLARNYLTKPGMMTPYHIICGSTGDHQELLALMIKALGRALLNAKCDDECTALMYAVWDANIKCVKCLIANEADVNLINNNPNVPYMNTGIVGPLIDSIQLLHPVCSHSYNTMMGIFDLLLDSGADVNKPCHLHNRTPIMYAADLGDVNCVEKLIQKGAQVNCTDKTGQTAWTLAARAGSVDVLKCLIEDNGIDKNSTDKDGLSILYWAVDCRKTEAVRYLLAQGVTMTSFVPQERVEACKKCGTNVPCHYLDAKQLDTDPYMHAIMYDILDVVKLMDEYGCQLGKSPEILSRAIRANSVDVVDYLFRKYKYPLDYGYIEKCNDSEFNSDHQTFLGKACDNHFVGMIRLLLEHGANPNKKYCAGGFSSVINAAIYRGHIIEHLACFIRGGANVNAGSYYPDMLWVPGLADIDVVLPFEGAVYMSDIYAAEMLLVAGCSRGIHSWNNNHTLKTNIGGKMKELLKEWNVRKNNVLPLKQRCRMVILNHLCPQADKKIIELPLPPQLIKYLGIPELDDIVDFNANY